MAFWYEGGTDYPVLRQFVEEIVGSTVTRVAEELLSDAWPDVLDSLPNAIMAAAYKYQADYLVVAADSDLKDIHTLPCDAACSSATQCRLCRLRGRAATALRRLNPPFSKIAVPILIATPIMEAYMMFGSHPTGEAHWRSLTPSQKQSHRASLKQQCYGTSSRDKRKIAEEAAIKLKGKAAALRAAFPSGFGCFQDAF